MADVIDIDLTPAAAARVAAIADRQGKPAILRLAVDGGGCAGFQYRFELADDVADDDVLAERDGVKLVVDTISLDLVRGSAVDFVENLGGAAFQVNNPPPEIWNTQIIISTIQEGSNAILDGLKLKFEKNKKPMKRGTT